eukprot:TRINITY_DN52430_c0_g1_i1.p1 TRINITY_DN52430_c0_g1~~TRINITY_DN52430_c0_g1_i1.p1  ORF type:complete len:561 (+),score=101.63 TRINITY_DN52430_c0_g1_i1:65-1684(+)
MTNATSVVTEAGKAAAAAALLGVPLGAEEAELRHAFREAARRHHPDKTGTGSSTEFIRLQEALDTLLMLTPNIVECRAASSGQVAAKAGRMKESERLDKHFVGTHFGSDNFDPRAWDCEADPFALAAEGLPVQCVWRCTMCPHGSSVCCRLKPKKHMCMCTHKVEAHQQSRGFRCGANGCRCMRLQFHVQQYGWEVKCRCKHHVKDHQASGPPPWRCTKRVPGKEQKLCPCDGFEAAWVCTCGHLWNNHETTWSASVPKAVFAREWVAQGLRPECVEEAEEKRQRWASEAASMAAELGSEEATRRVASKAKRMGISMCAEARMKEAVEETFDGSRLPADDSSTVRLHDVAVLTVDGRPTAVTTHAARSEKQTASINARTASKPAVHDVTLAGLRTQLPSRRPTQHPPPPPPKKPASSPACLRSAAATRASAARTASSQPQAKSTALLEKGSPSARDDSAAEAVAEPRLRASTTLGFASPPPSSTTSHGRTRSPSLSVSVQGTEEAKVEFVGMARRREEVEELQPFSSKSTSGVSRRGST